jgi:hypothetical protein
MKIEDVINRAVVIDNKEEEGSAIAKALSDADVHTDFILVDDGSIDEINTFIHPRELIVADLLLNENKNEAITNISRLIGIINKLQPKDSKFYGIIIWTKHKELAQDFLDRISRVVKIGGEKKDECNEEDEVITQVFLTNPPLFILCLDKMGYMKDGRWNFNDLLQDINAKLTESKTAYFSLKWKQTINKSIENVTNDIFRLSTDYKKHEEELSYILKALSQNETGEKENVNLAIGAYKAFDNLLHSELSSIIRNENLPDLSGITENPYGDNISKLQEMSAKINTSLFIDSQNLNTQEVIPGNIYRILDSNSYLTVPSGEVVEIPIKGEGDKYVRSKNYNKVDIAIELTPPCDFTNKKIYSRFVGGYVFDVPLGKNKVGKRDMVFDSPREDKRYAVSPIVVPGEDKVKCIVFDFRYLWTLNENEVLDNTKYALWFKAKPGLFADILQKFSSHASRLGINDIHLEK